MKTRESVKIHIFKSCFFENLNKVNNLLPRLLRKKEIPIINIRFKGLYITSLGIKNVMQESYK